MHLARYPSDSEQNVGNNGTLRRMNQQYPMKRFFFVVETLHTIFENYNTIGGYW